jgi:LacI family transcriptional regulator
VKDSTVRLEDIARRAGVSKNTVSVALRNKPGVSDKRRAEIQRIAEEMGYRPNPMVSALMHDLRASRPAAATNNIAFLHYYTKRDEWKSQLYCRELFEGIKSQGARSGFSASVIWGAEPGLNPARLHEMLRSRGVSGVIFAPVPDGRRHVRLDCSDFALATVGYSLWRPALNRACSHMRHAVLVAVRNLRKLGYERIGVAWYPAQDARREFAASAGLATARETYSDGLCRPFRGIK